MVMSTREVQTRNEESRNLACQWPAIMAWQWLLVTIDGKDDDEVGLV